MAWWLPVLLSGLSSAIGSGISAGTTSGANRDQALAAAVARARFAPILARLNNPDFSGLDKRAIREFSRADDQIGSHAAATGMMDAGRGGFDDLMSSAAVDIVSQLAEAKAEIEARNDQLAAQILSGEAFMTPDAESFNPGRDALLGFLGGAGAGAGQGLATLMGTEFGAEALGITDGSPTPTPAPGPTDFGVRYQGLGLETNFPRTTGRLGGNLQYGPRYAPQIRGFN